MRAETAEKILGWGVKEIPGEEILKAFREGKSYSILELKNEKIVYFLNPVRALSEKEALLLKQVVAEFQSSKKNASETEIYNSLKEHCIENLVQLSREQRELLLQLFKRQVFGFGAMDFLLEDEEIEEISIIGLGRGKPVFVFQRAFGWLETNLYYCSEQTVKELVNKMARKLERRLTLHTPRINAVLPDGSRLNAVIAPISLFGPSITIRKFNKKPFTPVQLVRNKTVSLQAMAFLWLAMQLDCSILIAGNTGSGKTSLLNTMFSFVPKQERIISVEETPEIVLPHKHLVKLNVVENLGIGMQELITDTLRMRPDRIIVGEIRTLGEAKAFIQTILAGQGKGSHATFHAQTAKECITRLKKFEIMEIDLHALDLLIVQKRWSRIDTEKNISREQRRVVEIAELVARENGLEIKKIFDFDFKNDCLKKICDSEKILEKAEKAFSKNREEIMGELEKREKKLKELAGKQLGFEEFFAEINKAKT